MRFTQFICVLLLAAIANPLCCCIAFADLGESPAAAAAAPEHSCCMAPGAKQSSEDAQHAKDSCPHAFEKESLISQHSDSVDTLLHLTASIALVEHPFLDWAVPVVPDTLAQGRLLAPQAATLANRLPQAQVSCVFLL